MLRGLDRTFEILATTSNEAATGVLLRALDSSDRDIADRALKAALQRTSASLAADVLRRWHTLGEHARCVIRERPGWLASAIRVAVHGYDEQLYRNGCEALLLEHEYDLAPVLVAAAENPANPFANLAAETTLLLAEQLHDETHAPRDYRERRDPALLRGFFLTALEAAVGNYARHGRRELIESFLLLAGRENALLRNLLQHPQGNVSSVLAEVLLTSSRPGVMRLLFQFLEDPLTPLAAVRLAPQRKDLTFLRHLFRKFTQQPTGGLLANVRRIESAAWLANGEAWLPSLKEAEQRGAVHFVEHAHLSSEQQCRFYELCLSQGGLQARRAASAALAKCNDPHVCNLIERCLEDGDGEVRANAVALIRPFHLPRAMERLLNCLAAGDERVRSAARAALSEFEFDNYLANFDTLDEDVRRSTGRLVRFVDPNANELLEQELRSNSRSRRRRAISMALAMGLVNELAEDLGRLLHDDDPYLRWDAVQALAEEDSPVTRRLLREALLDVHPLVHQAAEEALLRHTAFKPQAPIIDLPAAEQAIDMPLSGATQ